MKETSLYEICGNHRGGGEHSKLLMSKAQGTNVHFAVSLLDPEPGRARALAPFFGRQGVRVTARQGEAPLASDANIRVLAMDDATAVARIVERPLRNDLLEAGILMAVPTFQGLGGFVMALGTTLTTGAREAQRQAGAILQRVAVLAGERHSSRQMSLPILNSTQMVRVRWHLHDQLTRSSIDFLERGYAEPAIFAVDGLTQRVYSLVAVETSKHMLRRELRDVTCQEVLPLLAKTKDSAGVVYYDSSDPWLYIVLARNGEQRWHLERTIELPASVPEPSIVKISSSEPSPTPSPVQKARISVTD